MKKILTGLMAMTCVLSFSLEANARGFKDPNGKKAKTTLDVVKVEKARTNSQKASISVKELRKTAIEKAQNLRKQVNDIFVYNLENMIKVNPTLRAEAKVNSAKVMIMIKALNKLDPVQFMFNAKAEIAKLKRDLIAQGISRKQVEELSKEICRI